MTRSAQLAATLGTQATVTTTAQTVVALPPSALDTAGQMRVYVNGAQIIRPFDPTMEQP